jgi:chromosome segregation ATPase
MPVRWGSSVAGEKRFSREAGEPWLAEAPPADAAVDAELEPSELLTRLERHAAESGRLKGRVQTLERALKTERDARRRLGETLQRERGAAKALHERAERGREAATEATEELERLRHAFAVSEQQLQISWSRLMQAEQQLALRERSLWRKLLRRPPKR